MCLDIMIPVISTMDSSRINRSPTAILFSYRNEWA